MAARDIGKKWGIVSFLALIQLLLVIIKIRGEGDYNWAAAFTPIWILLALWAIYMIVQTYLVRSSRTTIDQDDLMSNGSTRLSQQQVGFRKIMSLCWTWFLLATLLIFFILLASFLDERDESTVPSDGTELVYPWIAYFSVVLFLVVIYAIISYCYPAPHTMDRIRSSTHQKLSSVIVGGTSGAIVLEQQQQQQQP